MTFTSAQVLITTVPKVSSFFYRLQTFFQGQRAKVVLVRSNSKDLYTLASLIERGQLRAVIEKVLPMQETVSGHQHVERKRTVGKVVLRI